MNVAPPLKSFVSVLIPLLVAAATASPALAVPASRGAALYQYLSPRPGARMVSLWNNVVIREGRDIDPASLTTGTISVAGTRSGEHAGRLLLSDDSKTIVFTPDQPFDLNETVAVRLTGGIETSDGHPLPPLTFTFQVSRVDPRRQPHPELAESAAGEEGASQVRRGVQETGPVRTNAAQSADLPEGYPVTELLVSDDPDPGKIFLAPYDRTMGPSQGDLLIVDNHNMPIFFRALPARAFGLTLQPDGRLTYYTTNHARFLVMDSTYTPVDTFQVGNGYITDEHELRILPNGHALMIAFDWEPVDMSLIVPGGDPDALVGGVILQEVDTMGNVVFQWRSWDHYQITDMIECVRSLTSSLVDYCHANSIAIDTDGNLLLSCRHMDEITKIDRATGDVIWRLGLNAKNNEFTFVGDSRGFSHQHCIRVLPNGHITMFDNGNCLSPEYSRSLEYELDQTNKIATLVWESRNTPDTFSFAMGSTQRHDNGTTTTGWGTNSDPCVTDVRPDGSKSWEIAFVGTIESYRALRFPWQTSLFSTVEDSLDFDTVLISAEGVLPLTVQNPAATDLDLTSFVSSDSAFSVTDPVPVVVPAGGSTVVAVRFRPHAQGHFEGTLYLRAANDTELVARTVEVRGVGVDVLPGLPAAGRVLLGVALVGAALWALRRRRPETAATD